MTLPYLCFSVPHELQKISFKKIIFLFFYPIFLIHPDVPAKVIANIENWNKLVKKNGDVYGPTWFNFFIALQNVEASLPMRPTKPNTCLMKDEMDKTLSQRTIIAE